MTAPHVQVIQIHSSSAPPSSSPHQRCSWRKAGRITSGCTLQGMPLGDWLQEQLFERRIVLVTGRLDDDTAARAAGALLTLDASGNQPIELHLDSPGGVLGAAFVLADTADALRSELRVLCRGQIGGPAIAVVAAADHRTAAAHTRFHLVQPTARFTGTPEEIAEDIRRGRYLDAREALDYGLIDEITGSR